MSATEHMTCCDSVTSNKAYILYTQQFFHLSAKYEKALMNETNTECRLEILKREKPWNNIKPLATSR